MMRKGLRKLSKELRKAEDIHLQFQKRDRPDAKSRVGGGNHFVVAYI